MFRPFNILALGARRLGPLRSRVAAGAALTGLCAVAVQALPTAAASPALQAGQLSEVKAAASPLPAPRFAEPSGATVEMFPTLRQGASLQDLLQRSGAARSDSTKVADLIESALGTGVASGTEVRVLLGVAVSKQGRRIERVSFKPGAAFRVTIGRTPAGDLKLVRDALNVDASPRKFSGRAGSDLFWSLRAAGVPATAAAEFIQAISTRVDTRDIEATDRFDLVIDHLRLENGDSAQGPLLYAGLHRARGPSVSLVRWTAGGSSTWFDAQNPDRQVDGFSKPVGGRLSSRFGQRFHPILRFARFHSGVDFSAGWGMPVIAAADATVEAAGWAGGYGRQVRLGHAGGVATSYSHLSGFAVAPGARVRRGDVIGYVGSSGLSTGPHLHFEVRKNGRPVDPLSFSFAPPPLTSVDVAAIRARAEQLRGA